MVKTLDSNQIQKLDGPSVYPIYLCHILLSGETLYFSDRCFRYNGHDYEDYLLNLPQTAQRIERLGGYFNLNASLIFKNMPLRAYNYLTEFFAANPITRREMELYILYHKKDEVYGSDVSTKLFRAAIGQKKDESRKSFTYEIFSILNHLDNKNIFTEINRTNWANAAPDAIGKYENIWYGALRDVPCHCVQTYAVSTLFLDLAASGETYITLSDVDYPIAFAGAGCVQIGSEQIDYSAKDSTKIGRAHV